MKSRAGAMILGLTALSALTLVGCEDAPPPPPPVEAAQPAIPFEPYVAQRLAALDAELADEDAPPEGEVDADQVRGLATMLGNDTGNLRDLALEEARGLGPAIVPALGDLAGDGDASDADRSGAIEILAALDAPAAAEILLGLMEAGEPSWVRAHAAWRLGTTSQDWVVPRTIKRLKYEKDHETVVWMARLLAHFGNYSGIRGLIAISADEASPQKDAALGSLGQILADVGLESLDELQTAWTNGDPEGKLPVYPYGPRFDRELWRWIDHFHDFQLRAVDDARFILENSGKHAAEEIMVALRDESLYVRLHIAQSLERMGPHAAVAGPSLMEALKDPDLAPNACDALGGIRYEPAGPAIVELLDPSVPIDLRLAATRALGRMEDNAPADAPAALQKVYESASLLEIQQAAAESLLRLDAGEAVLPFLTELLVDARVDSASTQRAIRSWLARKTETGDTDAEELLQGWDELALPTDKVASMDERRAAREARRQLLVDALRL